MISNLYSPGTIGGLTAKNRIVMTAMHTALSENGAVGEDLLEYFRRRAAGGAGILVVGAAGVDPLRINTHGVIGLYDDRFVPGLSRLAEEIHEHDCRCMAQLFHPGRYAKSAEYGGETAVAPSAIPSRFTRETPRELELDEVREIAGFYISAARRAESAGFDGVEITAASGYLPAQFLSPLTNHRLDPYGGPLQARLSFLRVLVAGIKDALGREFPVMVRIGANDFMEGGNTSRESVTIAVEMEHAGADAVSVTGGWHESPVPQLTMDVPPGFLAYQAKRIKKAVTIPVVVSNRMNPRIAEELVDSESVDFVGFGRGLLADPDMPKKAFEGRYGDIRPCIACNQGCMDRIFFGKTVSCLVNPEAGGEAEEKRRPASSAPAANPRSILVIGGGIAGLQFAVTAASRGYRPTVWEREAEAGGQALIAAGLEERREIAEFVDYLLGQCRKMSIPVICGKEADEKNIREAMDAGAFDRVMIAAGKRPGISEIETDGSLPLVHGWEVLRGKPVPGRRVLIAGGGPLGIWTALKLANRGRMTGEQFRFLNLFQAENPELLSSLLSEVTSEITVMEAGEKIGKGMGPSSKWIYLSRLDQVGATALTGHEAVGIKDGIISVICPDGEVRGFPADAVVETRAFIDDGELFDRLQAEASRVSLIGGSTDRVNMMDAVSEAYEEAMSL